MANIDEMKEEKAVTRRQKKAGKLKSYDFGGRSANVRSAFEEQLINKPVRQDLYELLN